MCLIEYEQGVITESKSGRMAISADRVVDCTGDADVAFLAGAKYRETLKVRCDLGLDDTMAKYFLLTLKTTGSKHLFFLQLCNISRRN